MSDVDRVLLKARIDEARDSTAALKELFDELVERLGHDDASQIWWAAFGAEDAANT